MKTARSLWQYYRDEPFMNNDGVIIDVHNDPNNAACKYKRKITVQTGNDETKDVQTIAPLKYSSNFWKTIEMPLLIMKLILL